MLPSEMDHHIPYPRSEFSSSQTKEATDSASVRGVSSKPYGTLKSTPISSRMVSKPYTMDVKPSPVVANPHPPKSRLVDSTRKPSPEDPATDRRAIAYQKYRGRLIDALIKDCQSRDLPSMGTKSDLIFRLVEDDLSHSKAKPPSSPFSVPSRLAPSSVAVSPHAVSPRGNLPIARTLLSPVKLFTHTTDQSAAETNPNPLGEKGKRREVPEVGGFGAASERNLETKVLESSMGHSKHGEAKRPPDSSLQIHSESRDMRSKPPVNVDVHAKEPVPMGPGGGEKKPETEAPVMGDEE